MRKKGLPVIDWGVRPGMPFAKVRRIKLINVFAGLAAVSTFPYIFVFYNESIFLSALSLFYFLCFLSTWLFNLKGKNHHAKFWLLISAHLYIFTTASMFGREAGEHLVLVPVLFGSVLVFEFKEKLGLIFSIALTLSTFGMLEVTDYSLFHVPLSPEQQLGYYQGNLIITLFCSISVASFYFYLYGKQLEENEEMIKASKEIEKTINYFSTSLFGKNTVDVILWDVAKNCIGRLGFVDCVIYLLDEEKQELTQKAAYGPKNPNEFEILKPIVIPVGKGIVGHVAATATPLIVGDTSKDTRYITDDAQRLSEITAPLIYNDKVIGVIDSEHPEKYFFTDGHMSVLKTIASLCANKIVRAIAEEESRKAAISRAEAEKIKALDELKTKLFANISHEFRTPLTLIKGTIDRCLKSPKSVEEKDWLTLERNTDRLLRLINQLLDLTKLESGHFRITKRPTETVSFLRIISSSISSAAEGKGVSLAQKFPNEPLWLSFDQDAMEKVLFNLISNAIKFSDEGGEVAIGADYKKGVLHLEVSDKGYGIEPDELDKIFDRFYQVGEQHDAGTGIGLALTKELVERHGGSIEVESVLGTGSCFKVDIPMEKAEPAYENEADIEKNIHEHEDGLPGQMEGGSVNDSTVLIVEDNADLLDFISRELQSNFRVFQAQDGDEGFRQAENLIPDLIISDVMMPKKDGIQLCRELKEGEKTSHIPVILLTAKADKESKFAGLKTGADDYLVKPFNSDELRLRIENLLVQRKKLKDKYSRLVLLQPKDIVITGMDELFLKRVMEVINRNIDNEDFSAEQFSYEVGMSRMQLHRKLKAITGHSATSFIRFHRINQAARLLTAGEHVSQTAYAVGFSSLSHFTRTFKKQFGVAPSEYK